MARAASTHVWQFLIGILLAFGAAPASAQQLGSLSEWGCWYNEDTNVICVLATTRPASPGQSAQVDKLLAEDTGTLRQQADSGALPKWLAAMRERPESFAGRRVTIPLYTHPEDPEFLHQLAETVMCGARKSCRVTWIARTTQLAQLSKALIAD